MNLRQLLNFSISVLDGDYELMGSAMDSLIEGDSKTAIRTLNTAVADNRREKHRISENIPPKGRIERIFRV